MTKYEYFMIRFKLKILNKFIELYSLAEKETDIRKLRELLNSTAEIMEVFKQ